MDHPEIILPSFVESSFENKVLDITTEQYHARKDAVHSSSLKHIIKSPHAYMWNLKHPKEETPAMKFGTLAHLAILEGSKFLSNYIVEPVFSGFTKDGVPTTSLNATSVKAAKAEWYAGLAAGTKVVTQEEFDKLRWMMDSLLSHKFVQEVLKDGVPELKMEWRDPVTGLLSICSHDFVSRANNVWVDVKTTTNCDWYKFRKSVEDLRYDFQEAMYGQGIEQVLDWKNYDKVWIALENTHPFECRVHYVDPYYQEAGLAEYRRSMIKLRDAIKGKHWPQGQVIIEAGEPSGIFKTKYDPILTEEAGA